MPELAAAQVRTGAHGAGLEGRALLLAVAAFVVFNSTRFGRYVTGIGANAEALAYLRDGEDALVVTRLDRLGRSLPDALRTVQALADRGIGLQALDVDLDTSTASGRLMLNMLLIKKVLFQEKESTV